MPSPNRIVVVRWIGRLAHALSVVAVSTTAGCYCSRGTGQNLPITLRFLFVYLEGRGRENRFYIFRCFRKRKKETEGSSHFGLDSQS